MRVAAGSMMVNGIVSVVVRVRMTVGVRMIVIMLVIMMVVMMVSTVLSADTLPQHSTADDGNRQPRYHAQNLRNLFRDDEME
jgi:hypothetical protein